MSSPIPAASGIYKITCTLTGKFYIGSSVNLRNRWRQHHSQLQRNEHRNLKMQAAWNKYGPDAFTFEVLELVLPVSLTAREQYWFHKLKPFGKIGFNLSPNAGSSLGRVVSPVTRQRISDANRGKPSPLRGRKCPPEFSEKISASNRRRTRVRKPVPEAIEKPDRSLIPYKHTPESRRKMREAAKNRPPVSAEAKENLRTAMKIEYSNNATLRNHLSEANAKRMKTIIAIAPDGTVHTVTGVNTFCKEHNLTWGGLMEVANGKRKQHKGWKAYFPKTDIS